MGGGDGGDASSFLFRSLGARWGSCPSSSGAQGNFSHPLRSKRSPPSPPPRAQILGLSQTSLTRHAPGCDEFVAHKGALLRPLVRVVFPFFPPAVEILSAPSAGLVIHPDARMLRWQTATTDSNFCQLCRLLDCVSDKSFWPFCAFCFLYFSRHPLIKLYGANNTRAPPSHVDRFSFNDIIRN